MHAHDQGIRIWFFIGVILLVYGVLISVSGVYQALNPPPPEQRVALWELHADIWWGALIAIFGLIYTWKFFPDREHLRQLAEVFKD